MYLTITDAAKALHMSRQWLYNMIDRGEINTAMIAGMRLVIKDDLFKSIQKKRQKAAA